ncbi:MAG TPA: sigma-70 family RNA polymerase sigma factor [Urbifossiella sp.]|nr:sigma-70 family RNA polymerase sigma factor [Urbifossiella sp.]
MADATLQALFRRIVHASASREAAGLPDAELLRRFAADRDEAAFAALVARHGPIVLDVCRAVLGNHADADDAFQATFLLLVRGAGLIRRPESLAAWLHGVAYRTALKAHTRAARRRKHEAQAPPRELPAVDDLRWAEVRRAVHEELAGLSERYRTVLVLCYLDGFTQERAAKALGLSSAAVKKRLERGREMLRKRFDRRGLGPTVLLAAAVVPTVVVPPALAAETARVVSLFAAGPLPPGMVSSSVIGLIRGGSRALLISKLTLLLPAALTMALAAVVESGRSGPLPMSAAAAADSPITTKDSADRDARRLAGTWKVRHVETDGKPLFDRDELADARITFADGKAEVKGLKVLFVGDFSFKIDPTQTPTAIDVTLLDGAMNGKTFEGIYFVRGDEARICLRLEHPEHGRPKGFATVSGTTLYTFSLDRVTAKSRGAEKSREKKSEVKSIPVPAPAVAGSCRVTGKVISTEYAKAGGAVERSIVYAFKTSDGNRIGESLSKERAFAFDLPPGQYQLQCTANGSRGATFEPTYKTVTIEKGETKLDLGTIDLPASEITKLFGKPAPELEGIAGWKNVRPLTIKELRGKVVVLDFWSHACTLCLHHKPDLAKLADRYQDKGLAVLTVHDNSEDDVDEALRKVPDAVKTKAGHLPVALDGKGKKGVFGAYGIHAVPTVILIDQEGIVVRRFHHAGAPELDKEIARLLKVSK